jgi:uncharacterized damage-inducible protein DinB
MNRIETLVKELRDVYQGAPWYGDSLQKTLAKIMEREANGKPLPKAHSIAELVGHITAWIEVVHRRIDGEVVRVTGAENFPRSGKWTERLRRLDQAHAALVARVSSMSDADLDRQIAGKRQTAEYAIRGVVQHCIYHQGQIALLRK